MMNKWTMIVLTYCFEGYNDDGNEEEWGVNAQKWKVPVQNTKMARGLGKSKFVHWMSE
jgi:hypothetical protein